MALYDIYFAGEITKDHDLSEVKPNLAKLFKINQTQVERLFSGKSVRIKAGVDENTANKYRAALRKIGAIVEIRQSQTAESAAPEKPAPTPQEAPATAAPAQAAPTPEEPPAVSAPAFMTAEADYGTLEGEELPGDRANAVDAPQAIPDFGVAPPRTGSLEEFAEEEHAVPLPDVDQIPLAPQGAELDDTPPPPEANIDISSLSAAPPNTGSLEDCTSNEPPAPIPDISKLGFAD